MPATVSSWPRSPSGSRVSFRSAARPKKCGSWKAMGGPGRSSGDSPSDPESGEVLEQLGEFVSGAARHDVAALVPDLVEMIADVFERQLGVVVALGEADEQARDPASGRAVGLSRDRALLVDQPGDDR